MSKRVIAVTMGDPGGIGPEVIVRSFRERRPSPRVCYLILGVRSVFEFLKRKTGLSYPFHLISSEEALCCRGKGVCFLDVSRDITCLWGRQKSKNFSCRIKKSGQNFLFRVGSISPANAVMAFAALRAATRLACQGYVQALVTAPLNKSAVRLIDPGFQGHTEYLAKASRTKDYAMMFVSDRLKVTLVTIHIPLKEVTRMITPRVVATKIRLTDNFLRSRFGIRKPRIAVCAINPHGMETGKEDKKLVLPAVQGLLKEGINIQGPLSSDRVFYDAYQGRFDAVVAMYHDQGLAPFKMTAFREGVNITVGLPFVRTSPDHGTAFDIAYKGKADLSSMLSAVKIAERLTEQSSVLAGAS